MNPKQLSIYLDQSQSLNIYREEVLGVFQNITLQFYNAQKQKVIDLTLHVKSHRAVLFHNTKKELYFEIHYNNIKEGIQPVKRGVFTREIYKLQLKYKDMRMYELKYPGRNNFEPVFSMLSQAMEKSKSMVKLSGQEHHKRAKLKARR